MKGLNDKVVIVTGAARGIGRAAVAGLVKAGAKVLASDLLLDELQVLENELKNCPGDISIVQQDVTHPGSWTDVFSLAEKAFGPVDVLVNNAGIAIIGSVEECSAEDWRKTLDVNVYSVFLGIQAGIEHMKARGGSIINVASIAGNVAEPRLCAYNTSKGAVRILTKNAAIHCTEARYPIRVNSLHPGYTETPLVANAIGGMPKKEGAEYSAKILSQIPMGRMAMPDEIAEPILFLASDSSSYMTGSELVVDGGYTAQ